MNELLAEINGLSASEFEPKVGDSNVPNRETELEARVAELEAALDALLEGKTE